MITAQFNQWQDCGYVHPLTCGKNSDHGALEAKSEGPDALIVECPLCEWSQTIVRGSTLYQILGQFNLVRPNFYGPTDGSTP